MGLSSHFQSLQNLCVNKEPLGYIQCEADCSPEPVLMSTEQRYALNSMTSDLIMLFLQDPLHTSHLPSTNYRKWGGAGQLLKSVTYG
jgi:hypothetical protein